MKKELIGKRYSTIKDKCAITTASSRTFAPFLLNMLASIRENFPTHPKIYVFDLGMTKSQRTELIGMPFITLSEVPRFAPFWNLCWSWKPVIWTIPPERFVLHLDSGLIVLRSLELWFLSIERNGYIAFSQGQKVGDIAPPDYIEKLSLKDTGVEDEEVFAAGVFGFDRQSKAGKAVEETARLSREGFALGWSAVEIHKAKGELDRILKACKLFRQDQTLINLVLRKYVKPKVLVRGQRKYLGVRTDRDHPKQFIWHARRKPASMKFFMKLHTTAWGAFLFNRLELKSKFSYREFKKRLKQYLRK